MKIIIVGSGGAEHALAWKLCQSPQVKSLWCIPGNGGTCNETLHCGARVVNVAIGPSNTDKICDFAKCNSADMVIVNSRSALSVGLVDQLLQQGISTFGPTQESARFQTSPAFFLDFCRSLQLPAVESECFTDVDIASQYVQEINGQCLVRREFISGGHQTSMIDTNDDVGNHLRTLLGHGRVREVVISHLHEGASASFNYLCDGRMSATFPPVRSYVRRNDGDSGSVTSGMGACLPYRTLDDRVRDTFKHDVFQRWLTECIERELNYKGLVHPIAIMCNDGRVRLQEINCRFSDPESANYMRMYSGDLVDFMVATVNGNFYNSRVPGPHWKPGYCVSVVMVDDGYPLTRSVGKEIEGITEAGTVEGVRIFHSGTTFVGGKHYTNGGRILTVTAKGFSPNLARERAYDAVSRITFEGASFRTDVASDLCFP